MFHSDCRKSHKASEALREWFPWIRTVAAPPVDGEEGEAQSAPSPTGQVHFVQDGVSQNWGPVVLFKVDGIVTLEPGFDITRAWVRKRGILASLPTGSVVDLLLRPWCSLWLQTNKPWKYGCCLAARLANPYSWGSKRSFLNPYNLYCEKYSKDVFMSAQCKDISVCLLVVQWWIGKGCFWI